MPKPAQQTEDEIERVIEDSRVIGTAYNTADSQLGSEDTSITKCTGKKHHFIQHLYREEKGNSHRLGEIANSITTCVQVQKRTTIIQLHTQLHIHVV